MSQFFALKGYELPSDTVVTVSATLGGSGESSEPPNPPDEVQDLIQLHPDASDHVEDDDDPDLDTDFDIVAEVSRFQKRGKFD